MSIHYRPYNSLEDLDLQTKIWLQATKELPWAWKPNKSQNWYVEQVKFDPRSKMYAFEDENPIGYMSCIDRETFIPLGFPWIVDKKFQGDIQHHLFDNIYNFCLANFRSKSFLQRFRKEWTYQINFFEDKGFKLDWFNPIYVLESVQNSNFDTPEKYEIKCSKSIPEEAFFEIINKDTNYTDQNKVEILSYLLNDIHVDWTLELSLNSKSLGMCMTTIRQDTGYAELVLFITDSDYSKNEELLLESVISQLKQDKVRFVSMTTKEDSSKIPFLESYNFKQKSESVFYSKKL